MCEALAGIVHRGRWAVVVLALVFVGVAAYFGVPVAGQMTNGDGDFDDPASESVAAERRLAVAGEVNPGADVISLVRTGENVRSPEAREQVEGVAERIGDDPAVARVLTFYDTREADWVSEDGGSTYVVASFDPTADGDAAAGRLREEFAGDGDVVLGGGAIVGPQVGETVGEDLARAELLAFPVLFLLSLWIFRGVVAALLPLFVGGIAVLGTFLGLRVVNVEVPLSVFALNLVTGLGLGLAIDYSLFMISRYREEISRHGPGLKAIHGTLSTAGRTVLFSSLTVAAALSSLLVFPQRFLYSMGVGGVLVALVAAAAALVVLPAVLVILGERVNALSPRRWRRAAEEEAGSVGSAPWYGLARRVMRRPVIVAVAASALLIVLALPVLGIKFTSVDASVLPESASARQVDEALDTEFPPGQESPIYLAARTPGEGPVVAENLRDYAAKVEGLRGVEAVVPPRFVGEDTWQVDVVPANAALSAESRELVRDIRALDAPYPVEAGGPSAAFSDQQTSLLASLPYALAVLVLSTLVLLFLFTGSVVLPLKTLLMNALTVGATFGVLVWIFQDGRFENLLGYTSQGALDNTQPIVVLVVAFALSTDYGVFLLSRIKEARENGYDDAEAVAIGVGRTGRIITAAALLFCVAIGAFATSEIVFIKQLGVGAALAVILDATVVRALLVPSLMKLLGSRNWWSPAPLRWLHRRVGLVEGAPARQAE